MVLQDCIMLKENSIFRPVKRESKRKRLPSRRGILDYFALGTADYRDCSHYIERSYRLLLTFAQGLRCMQNRSVIKTSWRGHRKGVVL